MTFSLFCRIVGVLVATSYAAWGLEAAAPLHPMVRRGAQATLSGLALLYVLHVLGVVQL